MLAPSASAAVGLAWRWVLRLVEPRSPEALASVGFAPFLPFRFHLPASLGSGPVTGFHRYYGRSDSCLETLSRRSLSRQVSLVHGPGLPSVPSPATSRLLPLLSSRCLQLGRLVPRVFCGSWASPVPHGLANDARLNRVHLRYGPDLHLLLLSTFASRRRSCSRLPAGYVRRERAFTSPT